MTVVTDFDQMSSDDLLNAKSLCELFADVEAIASKYQDEGDRAAFQAAMRQHIAEINETLKELGIDT